MLGPELREDSPFSACRKYVSPSMKISTAWRRNVVTSLLKIIPGIFRARAECWENHFRDSKNRTDTHTFCDKHLNVANFVTNIPEQI